MYVHADYISFMYSNNTDSVWKLQYDLELVFVKNSHAFVHEYMKKPEFIDLMRRLGALGDGNQDQSKTSIVQLIRYLLVLCYRYFTFWIKSAGTLSPDEWEVAYLYLAYVLRKVSFKLHLFYIEVSNSRVR